MRKILSLRIPYLKCNWCIKYLANYTRLDNLLFYFILMARDNINTNIIVIYVIKHMLCYLCETDMGLLE